MIGLHEIPIGVETTLVHVPSLRVDNAPLPQVSVEDLTEGAGAAGRSVVALDNAIVDLFDQVLTDPSGLGTTTPRRVHCAAIGPTIGRHYAVEDVGGEAEIVSAVGVDFEFIDTAAPLSRSYPSGTARIRGIELRVTVPAGATNEAMLEQERPLLVRWRYSIRGTPIVVDEQARVVRTLGHERYLGDVEAALREEWPELVQQLPRRPGALGSLVRGCGRSLAVRLRARNIDPAGFLAGPAGLEVLMAFCVWHFGLRGLIPKAGVDATTWTDWQRTHYLNLWNAVVKGSPGRDVVDVDLRTDTAPPGHSRKRRRLIALK